MIIGAIFDRKYGRCDGRFMQLIEQIYQQYNEIIAKDDGLSEYCADPKLYVACSGGRDSLSLAFALICLYKENKLPRPTLIHVNHHTQQLSAEWAKQVQLFAQVHGVDCHIQAVFLDKFSEAKARYARYQTIFEVMDNGGILLLAHHANDQAETLLMRLINGASVKGLAAMPKMSVRTYGDKSLLLWRPWLEMPRAMIEKFAAVHCLPFVDDPSNVGADNTRGFLRQEILPKLQMLNPQAINNIARTATLCHMGDEVMDRQLMAILPTLIYDGNCQQILDINKWQQLEAPNDALKKMLLHRFIQGDSWALCQMSLVQHIWVLIHRTDNDHNSEIYWQGGEAVFCRYRGFLYRYEAKLWQNFGKSEQLGWQICRQGIVCSPYFVDFTVLDKLSDGGAVQNICQVNKEDKIWVNHKFLSGKKLYQSLGIASWLRGYLWFIDQKDCQYLISIGQAWRLDKGLQLQFLPILTSTQK